MNFPVFDLHCDTALAMLGADFRAQGRLRKNSFHIDLERASKYPGYAQCFACFTSPLEKLPGRYTVEDMFERELSVLLREFNDNHDLIRQAFNAKDILENQDEGRMSAVLTIEGPAGFGYDPALLENLWQIGFRITNLGWNEKNPLTGSHKTGEGLADLGREFVREAQRLGMLVDVSHISDKGFWDIIDITTGPVIATHSNSRFMCDNSRNLTNDMFMAICKTDGVAGINMCADFVGPNATLDTVCDHIIHFLELDPSGKHIALGGDLDGVDQFPEGFAGVQSYDALAQRLLDRGVGRDTVMDIYWNNAIGVFEKCCM